MLGSVYALVALGYTMVYGIMGLINFAHGEVVMVGALVAITAIKIFFGIAPQVPGGVLVLAGLAVAIPVCMAVGYTVERVAYRPLRHAPKLAPLITAIGVSIVLQNLAMIIWGRSYISFPAVLPEARRNFFGATITDVQILIVVLALIIMAALLLLVNRTKMGRAMRATAENPAVAGLMGVNINAVISFTFIIGSALAAVAGLMVAANYGIAHYYMGFLLGLKAFTAAVLGGIGNLRGAVLGGLLLGLIESLGGGYIGDATNVCLLRDLSTSVAALCEGKTNLNVLGSHYQDVFAFFVLIFVLIFRPSGLMGEKTSERA